MSIGNVIRWLYYRLAYRTLMRVSHYYGWHHCHVARPEHDVLHICSWCGLTYKEPKRESK